jgi:hypothetical protein
MNMNQELSLATSMKLKEAGWKQRDSDFYWSTFINISSTTPTVILSELVSNEELDEVSERSHLKHLKFFAAPTTDDLLEALPIDISLDKDIDGYHAGFRLDNEAEVKVAPKDTPSEALASLWLSLHANKP